MQDEFDRMLQAVDDHGSGSVWYLEEGLYHQVGKTLFYLTPTRLYEKSDKAMWFRETHQWDVHPGWLVGVHQSISAAGILCMHTTDVTSTGYELARLYKRAQEGWKSSMTKASPRSKHRLVHDPKVRSLLGLWPKLSAAQAVALLERDGFQALVLAIGELDKPAMQEDFLSIKGIGQKTIDSMLEVLK